MSHYDSSSGRPLSPHLQVYRPQISSVLSIMHRGTGVFLSLGTLAIVYWLFSLATGPQAYAQALECFRSTLGQVLLAGWTFSIFYHLFNGIRHLNWDLGKGFELCSMRMTGILVVLAALASTAYVWQGFLMGVLS